MGRFGAAEAMLMFVTDRVRQCLVMLCGVASLQLTACAASMQRDAETMAEIERLRAAVRQSEERVVTMQAQQAELTQQLRLLSAFVGAIANDAAIRRAETNPKVQGFTGNPIAPISPPVEAAKRPDSPELEF